MPYDEYNNDDMNFANEYDNEQTLLDRFPQMDPTKTIKIRDIMQEEDTSRSGDDIVDEMEMSYYAEPEKARELYKEADDAPTYEQAIALAKKKGVQGGRGVIAMITQGLLTAVSGGSVQDVNKIYTDNEANIQKGTAREIGYVKDAEAKRVADKREGRVDEAYDRKQGMQGKQDALTAELDQIDSPETNSLRELFKARLTSAGMGEIANKLDSMTGTQITSLADRIAPDMAAELKHKLATELATTKATTKAATTAALPSAGQKKLDQNYAKDYNDWTTVGLAQTEKSIGQLEQSIIKLEKAKKELFGTTSGRIVGELPAILRTAESRVLEADVRESALAGIRAAMGAQFTEKEGERVLGMAYDPLLEPDENIKKINTTIKELQSRSSAQESKRKHWEQNNSSLSGWKSVGLQESGDDTTKVRMIAPNGKTILVPVGKVEEAESNGAKKI